MGPHPPPSGRALHSVQIRGRPWSPGGRAGKQCQLRLGGKPPRGAVLHTWTAYFPGLPPALYKRPPTHRSPSPHFDSPLKKGPGPPRSGLRMECPEGKAPTSRPLGAPLVRPFVPRAALGAAEGQRRGPGR